MPPEDPNAKQAHKLVVLSRVFGYGGLAALFVLTPLSYLVTDDFYVGMIIGGLAAMSVFTGAILGQIGRGMQGRVI